MPVPDFLTPPLTVYQIAEQYWDLKFIPTQYVFSLLALVSEDTLERDKCIELSTAEGQEEWLNYCRRPRRTVLEVLQDFHKSASKLTLPIIFELFSPIKPRSFSIASSCLTDFTKLEVLVAAVKYYSKLKKARMGLCSNWLVGLGVGDGLFGWIKKGTFVFPDEKTPQILIGPGTGLAPFRSHILQSATSLRHQSATSLRHLHLYFGCRYREKDFHCREEMERWRESGLHLFCAFSRDQGEKIYVQHKIGETSDQLWPLINNNAHVFISGNAKNMPDNVKSAFIEDVFMKTGKMGEDEAKSLMKKMEDSGRWQTETW